MSSSLTSFLRTSTARSRSLTSITKSLYLDVSITHLCFSGFASGTWAGRLLQMPYSSSPIVILMWMGLGILLNSHINELGVHLIRCFQTEGSICFSERQQRQAFRLPGLLRLWRLHKPPFCSAFCTTSHLFVRC